MYTIDNTLPGGEAMFFDTRNAVLVQHGGAVTRIDFTKVERMSLEEWREREAPKLSPDSGDMHLLRNSAAGYYTAIVGDCAVKYHVKDVYEVPLDELSKHLKDKVPGTEVYAWDIPFRVICRAVKADSISTTVYVPPKRIRYRNSRINVNLQITLPPLWFRVDMSKTFALRGAGVVCVPEESVSWKTADLRAWPLTNVFEGVGDICFGNTVINVKADTEGEVISYTLSRFLDSDWNLDLLPGALGEVLGTAYDALPESARVLAGHGRIGSSYGSISTLLKVLSVMALPDGWGSLKLAPARISPETFCHA